MANTVIRASYKDDANMAISDNEGNRFAKKAGVVEAACGHVPQAYNDKGLIGSAFSSLRSLGVADVIGEASGMELSTVLALAKKLQPYGVKNAEVTLTLEEDAPNPLRHFCTSAKATGLLAPR